LTGDAQSMVFMDAATKDVGGQQTEECGLHGASLARPITTDPAANE
jgi:hypothetical protein